MASTFSGKRSPRQLKVGEEIRQILSDLFRRGDFRDPALHDLNMTVTEVRISPDLKNATAYVIRLGGKGTEDTIKPLNHAAPFFRSQVAKKLSLRYTPILTFEADVSLDYAQKINSLLHRPEVSQDLDTENENDA